MRSKHRRYSAEFKFKVALEAAKGTKAINRLASEYELHPSQISQWKHQLLEEGAVVFANQSVIRQEREQQKVQAQLYEEIGRLKVELEWLKKLPGTYALELNLEEYCHGSVKQRMRNGRYREPRQIRKALDAGFARLRKRPDLLRSFFQHAGLEHVN